MLAIVYEAKRPSKKNLSLLEPFMKPNVTLIGSTPVQNPTIFPNGLFTMADDDSTGKKWLFFVYPQYRDCDGERVLLADHMTFCTCNSKTGDSRTHATSLAEIEWLQRLAFTATTECRFNGR